MDTPQRAVSPSRTNPPNVATSSAGAMDGSSTWAQYSSTASTPSRVRLPASARRTALSPSPSMWSGNPPTSVGWAPTLVLSLTRTPGLAASQRPSNASLWPPKPVSEVQKL